VQKKAFAHPIQAAVKSPFIVYLPGTSEMPGRFLQSPHPLSEGETLMG